MLGGSIHTAALAKLSKARCSFGLLAPGAWGGPEGAFNSETPSSLARHVLSAGLYGKLPPAFPASPCFPSLGALRQGPLGK